MNKQAKIGIIVAVILAVVLASSFVLAPPPHRECRDGIDNDGDGATDWPADAGCSNKNDNDETNCGDGVCEGGETSSSCAADCAIPDSCSDTDGGFITGLSGTVSGNFNEVPYSIDDSCSGTTLTENYCAASLAFSAPVECSTGNSTTDCVNGACV